MIKRGLYIGISFLIISMLFGCGHSNGKEVTNSLVSNEIQEGRKEVSIHAMSEAIFLHEDSKIAINLDAYAISNDKLSYKIVTKPRHGKLTGEAPYLTYQPDSNYAGNDSFSFYVTSGEYKSNIATVSLFCENIDDTPIAYKRDISFEDKEIKISLFAQDVDSSDLKYEIVQKPKYGHLEGTIPDLLYRADNDLAKNDTISYKVSDQNGYSTIKEINIFTKQRVKLPQAQEQKISKNEGEEVAIQLQVKGFSDQGIEYKIIKEPKNGKIVEFDKVSGYLKYKPKSKYFHGFDSFNFTASNSKLTATPALISLHFKDKNNKPIAYSDTIHLLESHEINITLKARDIDYDSLRYEIVSKPKYGNLQSNGKEVTYIPDKNFYGHDSFSFRVDDGEIKSEIATIDLDVKKALRFNFVKTDAHLKGQNMVFSKDQTRVFSVGEDHNLTVYSFDGNKPKEIATLNLNASIPADHFKISLYHYQISDDGKRLYVPISKGFKFYDISDPLQPILIVDYNSSITTVHSIYEYSRDNHILFIERSDKDGYGRYRVDIVDISDPQNPKVIKKDIAGKIDWMSLSPDGNYIYSLKYDDFQVTDIRDIYHLQTEHFHHGQYDKFIYSNDKKYAYALNRSYVTGNILKYDMKDIAHPKLMQRISSLMFNKFKNYDSLFISADNNILYCTNDYNTDVVAIDTADMILIGQLTKDQNFLLKKGDIEFGWRNNFVLSKDKDEFYFVGSERSGYTFYKLKIER